jgi:hypothetical protein
MKRGIHILFFLVFILIILPLIISINVIGKDITGNVINKDITGGVITGDATQQIVMNIDVIAYFPFLSIISPGNKTYLTNESLLLNYSVSNEQAAWYNLDNSANITLTSQTYFNASQGSHILYLYANSSFGNVTARNVTFLINSSKFIILDDKFDDGDVNDSETKNKRENKKGQSTDYLDYSYEEIQNLSNVILHNPNNGKIYFNQPINLTDDENVTDGLIDLDTNVDISFNRIEINSTALPNFNKPATLEFYNLTFSNPRILRDGSVCSSLICTEENYSGGTLKFNVTGFSVYTSEETPVEALYTAPGGGSGGGGSRTAIPSKELEFEVEPELIEVMIKKGETFKFSIKVKNNGISTQEFKAEVLYLQDSVSIQNPEFSLKPGEEKEVILIFSPPDSLKEDTYTGKIKISSEGQEKEIPVIFSLKSKIVLFDLTLLIPPNYKEIMPGGDVLFQISIFNLGGGGRTDVEVTYYIKDFEGNIISEQKGVVGVETQASFSRTIKLPGDIKEGQYIVGANARYDHSIGTASDIFYIKELESGLIKKIIPISIILLASLIILIGLIILYFKRKIKKTSKAYKKELNIIEHRIKKGNLKLTETVKIENKLKSQLDLLNKAYGNKYITKQAYEAGKSRIKNAENKIKKKCL